MLGRPALIVLDLLTFSPGTKFEQASRRLVRKIADDITIEAGLDLNGTGQVKLFGPGLSLESAGAVRQEAAHIGPWRFCPTTDWLVLPPLVGEDCFQRTFFRIFEKAVALVWTNCYHAISEKDGMMIGQKNAHQELVEIIAELLETLLEGDETCGDLRSRRAP